MSGAEARPRVLKFGGSSVAEAVRLELAAGIVREAARGSGRVWVVVSALAGVTDVLQRAARRGAGSRRATAELARRHRAVLVALGARRRWRGVARRWLERLPSRLAAASGGNPWALEWVLAVGERLAAPAMAAALERRGLGVALVDATRVVAVRGGPGRAEVDLPATARRVARVDRTLPPGVVAVVPGFFGGDARGRPVTLGRGASDLSAAVLGAVLGAAVEIRSDVPGVLSAPPRWVPDAGPVERLGWREAAWLAELGARVLHREAARCLERRRVPAVVASTLEPAREGTRIHGGGASTPVLAGCRGWAAVARGVPGALEVRPLMPVAGPDALRAGPGPEPVAVVGVLGVPRDGVAAAVRRLRLPVLGEVPALAGPGVVLAVREVWLPRTVAALHGALVSGGGGRAGWAVSGGGP